MSIARGEVIRRWVEDIAHNGDLVKRKGYTSGTLRDHTRLQGFPDRFVMTANGREIILAQRFVDRGYIALNGDGLGRGWGAQPATRWQTELRQAVQNNLKLTSMVIPFAAVAGAGVDLATVKLIDVLDDGWVMNRHPVPSPPEEMRLDVSNLGGNSSLVVSPDPEGDPTTPMYFYYRRQHVGGQIQFVMHESETINALGRLGWRAITFAVDGARWEWSERVHQLGEALFSAVGEDGQRHKFISGFDRNEREPLYFLAQLPDGSGATKIADAVKALAPPIVHQAWDQKLKVSRQGDIFFIPTELRDEQVYAMGARRVRRQCVLEAERPIRGQNGAMPVPVKGEVRSRVICPCMCGHLRWTSNTPLGRRTLAIYGTAHTADEVVVTRQGAVYARGTVHHDPPVIGEERRPDHQQVVLQDKKWHLAVRNTVPRRRTPRPVPEEVNA